MRRERFILDDANSLVGLAFAQKIGFTFILILLSARSAVAAVTDTICKASVQSLLPRFLASGEPFNDNSLFLSLSDCAVPGRTSAIRSTLLVRPKAARQPLEIIGAGTGPRCVGLGLPATRRRRGRSSTVSALCAIPARGLG